MSSRSTWGVAVAAMVWLGLAPAKVTAGDAIEMSFGGSAILGQALGDFADQVGTPYGLGGHIAWARPGKPFGLRIEVTGLIYGSETRQVPVGQPGLRQSLTVETTNGMATLGLGPQWVAPRGSVRPYLTAFAGLSYFSTDSTVRADVDLFPIAQSTNYDDTVFAYGGGLGILIPLSASKSGGLALDVGARFVGGGEVRYLAEGAITDLPGGDIAFTPLRTKANRIEFHIGLSGIP